MDANKNRIVMTLGLVGISLGSVATAQVSFTDVTAEVGIDFVGSYGEALALDPDVKKGAATDLEIVQRNMGNGVAVGDYDNDGDFDLFLLAQQGMASVLYRNDDGQFVDVTSASGLGNTGASRSAAFVDLNNDGWRDLVVANDHRCGGSEPASSIYRNDGNGTFSDVTPGSGFDFTGFIVGGLGFVDYQRDGLLDIYVTTWGALQDNSYTYLEGYNRLYRNKGNFEFVDTTRTLGLGQLRTNSFSPIFADFDSDGDSDLFVAVDGYTDAYYRFENRQFHEEAALVGATHVGSDMGVAPADIDNDGDIDLFCTNATLPGSPGDNVLLINQVVPTGVLSFVNEAEERGVSDTGWGWGTEWVDVDNDGDRDLFAVNGFDEFIDKNYDAFIAAGLIGRASDLFLNDGSGQFAASQGSGAEVIGDARAAVAFDYDQDGDQDLLITHMNSSPVLLRNDTASSGAWLDVELVGGGRVCRDAVGARLQVVAGGTVYNHEVICGGSYLTGRPLLAHFGLGDAEAISEVRVFWPGGQSTTVSDVAPNGRMTIVHPAAQ